MARPFDTRGRAAILGADARRLHACWAIATDKKPFALLVGEARLASQPSPQAVSQGVAEPTEVSADASDLAGEACKLL